VSSLLAIWRTFNNPGDLYLEISLATILLGVVILLIFLKKRFVNFGGICLILLAVLFFYTSHQMTLLNVDRSRSFYIIGWVHDGNVKVNSNSYNYDAVLSLEKLNTIAADVRLSEQINRGYITQRGDTLELTPSGKILFQIAEFLSQIYTLDNWKFNKS
jgi:hypothetical protein